MKYFRIDYNPVTRAFMNERQASCFGKSSIVKEDILREKPGNPHHFRTRTMFWPDWQTGPLENRRSCARR